MLPRTLVASYLFLVRRFESSCKWWIYQYQFLATSKTSYRICLNSAEDLVLDSWSEVSLFNRSLMLSGCIEVICSGMMLRYPTSQRPIPRQFQLPDISRKTIGQQFCCLLGRGLFIHLVPAKSIGEILSQYYYVIASFSQGRHNSNPIRR